MHAKCLAQCLAWTYFNSAQLTVGHNYYDPHKEEGIENVSWEGEYAGHPIYISGVGKKPFEITCKLWSRMERVQAESDKG